MLNTISQDTTSNGDAPGVRKRRNSEKQTKQKEDEAEQEKKYTPEQVQAVKRYVTNGYLNLSAEV